MSTGVTAARGFRAAGVAAGLKASGKKDVAVVVNDGPLSAAAAVYTSNRCKANPVLWSQEAMKGGSAKAVVLNSGGANCYTGPVGFEVTHATAELAAELVGAGAIDVQVCSTGLIGLVNDKDDLLAGVRAAFSELSAEGGASATHGDAAVTSKNTAPVSRTADKTSDSTSAVMLRSLEKRS